MGEVKISFYNRRGGNQIRQSTTQHNPLEMSGEEIHEEIDYQEDDKDDDDEIYDRDFAQSMPAHLAIH